MAPRRSQRSLGRAETVPAAASVAAPRGAKAAALRGTRGGGVQKEKNILRNRQIKKGNLVHWSRMCRPGTSCNGMIMKNIARDLREILNNTSDPVLAAKLDAEIRAFIVNPKKSRADRALGNQFAAAGREDAAAGREDATAAAAAAAAGGGGRGNVGPSITLQFPHIVAAVLGGAGSIGVTAAGIDIEGQQILQLFQYLRGAVREQSGWLTHPEARFAQYVLVNILSIYDMWNARAAAKAANNTKEAHRITRTMFAKMITLVKRSYWIYTNYMVLKKYWGRVTNVAKLPSILATGLANLHTSLTAPTSSTLPIPLNARHANQVLSAIRMRELSKYAPPPRTVLGAVSGARRVAMTTARTYGGAALSVATANPIITLVGCLAAVIAVLVLTGTITLPKRGNIKTAVTRGAKRARNAAMEEVRNAAAAYTGQP